MRRPHGSNRTDTLLPYTTLFRARRGKAGEYQRHFIAELDPELQARALADFRWQLVTGAVVESVDVVGTVVVRRQARCDVRGQRQIRVDARARVVEARGVTGLDRGFGRLARILAPDRNRDRKSTRL